MKRTLTTGSTLLAALAATLLLNPAVADTITVDDDGGSDFTDLPDAIAAASPGDLILVAPGSYSSFVLGIGVTILGSSGALVAADSSVSSLPQNQKAAIADLEFAGDLSVVFCDGRVLLHRVELSSFTASGSTDVRVHESTIQGSTLAVGASSSRVELVQTTVEGKAGASSDCGDAGDGFDAMHLGAAGRVHASLSDVRGGQGGYFNGTCVSFCTGISGLGGEAIVSSGGELIITGITSNEVVGGHSCSSEFGCDGDGGNGIVLNSGNLRVSGASVLPGLSCGGFGSGADGEAIVHVGGTLDEPDPRDSSLELLGNSTVGGQVQFVIHGAVGANVRLFMGRNSQLDADPGIVIEKLATRERALALGQLPGSGSIQFNQPIPATLPQGFAFWAQAELVALDGTVTRTNSVAVLLR